MREVLTNRLVLVFGVGEVAGPSVLRIGCGASGKPMNGNYSFFNTKFNSHLIANSRCRQATLVTGWVLCGLGVDFS